MSSANMLEEGQAQTGQTRCVAAVILAAGKSNRMGGPKLLLPWGRSTVIGKIVTVLLEAKIDPIVVVTGAHRNQVLAALKGLAVLPAHNDRYERFGMTQSAQVGLQTLPGSSPATLIVLGDQPQLEPRIVCRLVEEWARSQCPVAVPVFEGRRGHPLLLDRRLWPELLAMDPDRSIRDLVHRHLDELCEVVVESSSVLADLDTPAEYRQALRQQNKQVR
ncbi:MAG: nucleotidyltransferase family protein [Anaerolineales bacterium]|jgi:molybdenum cofactor cytidylyltransferase